MYPSVSFLFPFLLPPSHLPSLHHIQTFRVFTYGEGNSTYPLVFSVRQRSDVVSWTIPLQPTGWAAMNSDTFAWSIQNSQFWYNWRFGYAWWVPRSSLYKWTSSRLGLKQHTILLGWRLYGYIRRRYSWANNLGNLRGHKTSSYFLQSFNPKILYLPMSGCNNSISLTILSHVYS